MWNPLSCLFVFQGSEKKESQGLCELMTLTQDHFIDSLMSTYGGGGMLLYSATFLKVN